MKAELTDFVLCLRDEAVNLAAGLPAQERDAPSTFEQWNYKDTMAHMGDSVRYLVERLRGQPPPPERDVEEINLELYERTRGLPWEEVLASFLRHFDSLLAALQDLTEEQLLNSGEVFIRANPNPLWRTITWLAALHPQIHMAGYLQQRGRADEALRVSERINAAARPVSTEPDWQAVLDYNQACLHAQCGQADAAVRLLLESFAASPRLRAFAREDSDLDTVRDHPELATALAE